MDLKFATTAQSLGDFLRDLERKGATVIRNSFAVGLCIDVMVKTPTGRSIIVDVKNWDNANSSEKRKKAERQTTLWKDLTGADYVFIATDIGDSVPECNIFSFSDLLSRISWIIDNESLHPVLGTNMAVLRESSSPDTPAVFVAMPFENHFDDTYFLGIGHAVSQIGGYCLRVDCEVFTESVISRIHEDIRNSAIVIADLTDSNPNVLYEVGFAHGLQKRVLFLSASSIDELPFNVRGWSIVRYTFGQIHKLQYELERRLRELLSL